METARAATPGSPLALLQLRRRRALEKALALGLQVAVERVRYGLYRVPSSTREQLTHTVTVDAHGHYGCTCEAGNRALPCVHQAAVYLAKVEASGAVVVAVN